MTLTRPSLKAKDYPEPEREYIQSLNDRLGQLLLCADTFRADVALLDHAYDLMQAEMAGGQKPSNLYIHWAFIAATDAASAVYRFGEDIEAIGINIGMCPTLRAAMDMAAKKDATKAFAGDFPDYKGLRHSGQHSGALWGTPERAAEHALDDWPSVRSINNLHDKTFVTTFEKKTITFDVTGDTADKLQAVAERYFDAFKGCA